MDRSRRKKLPFADEKHHMRMRNVSNGSITGSTNASENVVVLFVSFTRDRVVLSANPDFHQLEPIMFGVTAPLAIGPKPANDVRA